MHRTGAKAVRDLLRRDAIGQATIDFRIEVRKHPPRLGFIDARQGKADMHEDILSG